MRSIKVFWAMGCILRRNKCLRTSFEKVVEKDLFLKPGLLNMAFRMVTNWTEIYLRSFVIEKEQAYVPNPPLITTVFLSTLVLSLAQDLNPRQFSKTFNEEIVYQLKGFLRQIKYPMSKFPASICLMEEFTFRSLALITNVNFFSSRWSLNS